MADRRGIVVPLLILTFIFLSPEPSRGPAGPLQYRQIFQDVITEEQRSLSVLQNTTYIPQRFDGEEAYGLNLTGLEAERGYAWSGIPLVKERAKERLAHALGDDDAPFALELDRSLEEHLALYENVTGSVQGKWVRSPLEARITAPALNLSQYALIGPFGRLPPQPFGRNITGKTGDVSISFHERDPRRLEDGELYGEMVVDMDLELSLSDDMSSEEWEMRLFGVYFPAAGHAVLSTNSDKFAGIFMLPHLSLSEAMYDNAQTLLNHSIARAIGRQLNGEIAGLNPWTDKLAGTPDTPFAPPECELIVYLQQQTPGGLPASSSPSAAMKFLETELRFPSGAFLPEVPALHFSMIAFSPDCGYVLESQGPPDYPVQDGAHLVGSKLEIVINAGRRHLLVFTFTIALQVILLMRQMREASTPSTRSKISFYSIAMLALGDGFTTMTFLLTSIFVNGLWVNLIQTAFLSFISVSFFGMRFLMDIWAVQAPERRRREREQAEEERQRRERVQEAVRNFRQLHGQVAQLEGQVAGQQTPDAIPPALPPPPRAGVATTNTQAVPAGPIPGVQSADSAATTNAVAASQSPTDNPTGTNNPQSAESPPTNTTTQPRPAIIQPPTDTGAGPIFMPSDQDGLYAAEDFGTINPAAAVTVSNVPSFGALYTRFYLLLLGTLFLSLNAASWPSPLRRTFFLLVALAYLSFWIPQIHRNVQRNCRRALNWEFVLGQSTLRLVPFAYFYGYTNNYLFAHTDYISLALLVTWVWIQVVLLGSQEIVGPRWFIRKDWAPPAYDYHPILRDDEEGATMPIGFSQATATADSVPTSPSIERRGSIVAKEMREKSGKRVFDCAICMQDLEVPIVGSGGSSGAGGSGGGDVSLGSGMLLARRTYMVTPCRHIFHSACLEGWMKFRLQCPICRETLPPL